MHLLSALAAGVTGAENGTCVIFKRGTATKATYYDDFEGTTATAQSASTELSLDSNGRFKAYVDEVVDVRVKDSSGNVVLTFTDGVSTPAVEVKSQSFTGVDYVTSASAAGNPTTLQAALDLWKTNAGSADFKIEGVTPTQLYNQTYTKSENVKRHGATGDGVDDDTSAITAAVTALGAAGGVVYFPPGTYRVTSVITIPEDVSLVGTGPENCTLTIDHATNDLINTSGTTSQRYAVIRGFTLTAAQANTGNAIEVASAAKVLVDNCYLGGSDSNGTLILGSGAEGDLSCRDCRFVSGAATTSHISMLVATSKTRLDGCQFEIVSGQSSTLVSVNDAQVFGCSFNPTVESVSGLTYLLFTGNLTAVGNHFLTPGIGTATPIFQSTMAADDEVHEVANNFDSSLAPYSYTSTDGAMQFYGTRVQRQVEVTDNSAAVTLNADQYGKIVLKRTVDSAQVISANKAPLGSRLTLYVWWTAGTTVNAPTFNATDFRAVTAISATTGAADVREFVSEDFSGTLKWTQVGARISVTV